METLGLHNQSSGRFLVLLCCWWLNTVCDAEPHWAWDFPSGSRTALASQNSSGLSVQPCHGKNSADSLNSKPLSERGLDHRPRCVHRPLIRSRLSSVEMHSSRWRVHVSSLLRPDYSCCPLLKSPGAVFEPHVSNALLDSLENIHSLFSFPTVNFVLLTEVPGYESSCDGHSSLLLLNYEAGNAAFCAAHQT